AYEHQDVPFEKVVETLVRERDMSRSPLFDVLFVGQNNARNMMENDNQEDLDISPARIDHHTAKFDLTFTLLEGAEGWEGSIEFCTDLYRKERICRMASHYKELLGAIVRQPFKNITTLPFLTVNERRQLLEEFNGIRDEYPADKTILDLFEARAASMPDAVALIYGDAQLTYGELDQRSNQLAHYLQHKGVGPESLVAICIERSLDMVMGIWGILKAGAAYVPIDPTYPTDRIQYMLADTGVTVAISSTAKKSKLTAGKITELIDLDEAWMIIGKEKKDREPAGELAFSVKPDQPAYVIYTSGSTGSPKGVMITHRNLMNFIAGMNKVLTPGSDDHLLAVTSIGFDISVLEICWTLIRGIKVTIKEDSQVNNFDRYVTDRKEIEMDFSLFYFASQGNTDQKNKYEFLLRSVAFADKNEFSGIWLPERHFHEFGGIFPNPSVLGAGMATITQNIEIRSGSVVLPLHDVIRVAEEWSVVDNLSNGRVSLSIASGWHADDFVLMPENFAQRHSCMYKQIQELKELWKGAGVKRVNGHEKEIEVKIFPRPVRPDLPIWITAAGSAETFRSAGTIGANILTHLLAQDIEELKKNITIYKQALKENGYPVKEAKIALMLHAYLGEDLDKVKSEVRKPFKSYLGSSISLIKNLARSLNIQTEDIDEKTIDELLEIAFERYWQTDALLGTIESCKALVQKVAAIGVTEIACLIDFGVGDKEALDALHYLNEFRKLFRHSVLKSKDKIAPISALQITPSYLNVLLEDGGSLLFLKELKYIIIGGEKLPPGLLKKLQAISEATVTNVYGPTETTIWSATKEINDPEEITIGKPILNTAIYILDSYGNLCPVGVPGELCIGGDGVARGYVNKVALTEEKFIRNPFGNDPVSRIYRTGDLAWWLDNGELVIAGRNDDQVKIRGYRIEPGEVEYFIGLCRGIKRNLVTVKESGSGDKFLVAYLEVEPGFDKSLLHNQLKESLPEYMIPAQFVELTQFPLTPNGKINRKALPDPVIKQEEGNLLIPPGTEMEYRLLPIWKNLLGAEQISVRDNFFELGGHSLLAIRVISAIRKELEIEVSVGEIFGHPTIESLGAVLAGREKIRILPPVVPQIRHERIPLSFSQERLWFLDQLEGSVQYNIPVVLRLKGELHKEALNYALQKIVDRHEILRTVIAQEEGKAYQYALESKSWSLAVVSDPVYEEEPAALSGYVDMLIRKPFDLSADHKIRVHLIKLQTEEHLLVIVVHHIASDGWSGRIMIKEFVEFYASYTEGRPAGVMTLPIQYADYAIWQRNYLKGDILNRKIGYWQNQLEGVTPLKLPTDFPRKQVQSSKGSSLSFVVNKELTDALLSFSKREGVTLFMTLLSVYKVLLFRYSGQSDISVGTAVAGRQQVEVEGLVGFFTNTLVLRSNVNESISFSDLLQQVKQMTLAAFENQEAPFEKVVEAVVKERDMNRSPLFQVMFDLQNKDKVRDGESFRLGWLEVLSETAVHGLSKYELSFSVVEHSMGMRVHMEYDTDLYREDTIIRMGKHYEMLLGSVTEDSMQLVGNLSLMTGEDKKQVLYQFNENGMIRIPDQTVADLFKEQVLRNPGAIALIWDREEMTFGELDSRSNRLSRYLRRQGVGRDSLVAICIGRSPDMIVGILGILKAGGTYVPIDPELPADRISYILQDTGAGIIVSDRICLSGLPADHKAVVILLDVDWTKIKTESDLPVHIDTEPTDLAYVLYTSGSSGRPKGVMVEHRSLINYLVNSKTRYIDAEESGNPASYIHLSYTFDAALTALFMPLIQGKPIVIGTGDPREPFRDDSFLKHGPYDFIKLTPAHLPLLEMSMRSSGAINLTKRLVVGGEALPLSHIAFWSGTGIEIVNEYGPTEATVGCSVFRIYNREHEILEDRKSIPIGKPIDNVQLYILDKYSKPVPVGVTGELCIGGIGLARGYLNQPEMTADRFIANSFNDEPESRLYRSGDLCRWLPDGNIEFLGRVDEQVKIRGYRIELGEIERVLEESGQVRQVAVLVNEDKLGNKRLIGYIVPQKEFDREGITSFLKSKLPDYMIPAYLIELDTFPLTSNGKIDRKRFPDPVAVIPFDQAYTAPRLQMEMDLAGIWKDLLDVDRVGIHDNFFGLGGDSIITIQVVSRARRLGYNSLKVGDLFEYQTISGLAEALIERDGCRKGVTNTEEIPLDGQCGLLPIQQAFLEQDNHQVSHYNQSVLLSIQKSVTAEELTEAVQGLLHHHDALRFRYHNGLSGWKQEYMAWSAEQSAFVREKSGSSSEITERAQFYQRSLDILKGELMRVVLFCTEASEEYNRLLIVIHHLAVDGVSWRILLEDMELLLSTRRSTEPAVQDWMRLGKKSHSYRAWFESLEQYGGSERALGQLGYWESVANRYMPLPVDKDYQGLVHQKDILLFRTTLNEDQTQRLLHQVTQAYHTEINDLLLGALGRTLNEWSGLDQVVIGLEGHGREDIGGVDISRTVGWFASVYPVLLKTGIGQSESALIRDVKERLRKIPDKGLGYGVLKFLIKAPGLQGNQPWDILFNYMGQLDNMVNRSEWFSGAQERLGDPVNEDRLVPEKLTINCMVIRGELILHWGYSSLHFREETIRRLADRYQAELEKLIDHCIGQRNGDVEYTTSEFGGLANVSHEEMDSFLSGDDSELSNIIEF
ncbi:amino acid adenylation domain-containing protein, partial [Flavitalea flava]